MIENQETPEERREKMRQKELKNPVSSVHGNNLSDLVGSFGWKGTGILMLVILIGFIIAFIFWR